MLAEVQTKEIVFGRKAAKLIIFNDIADSKNREKFSKKQRRVNSSQEIKTAVSLVFVAF
jgi:hypothetical protein